MKPLSRLLVAAALACVGPAAAQDDGSANRVVHLHYDYMIGPGGSRAPDPRSIEIVVDAFRRQGITLHVDPIHHAIPERGVVTLPAWGAGFDDPACAGSDAVSIEDLRASYLQPRGNQTWHYAVFARYAVCPDTAHCSACPPDAMTGGRPDPTSAGAAEMMGTNLVVASGNLDPLHRVSNEAGTLMHELGHNLGLHHGGDEVANRKPNYLSVMNYSYQFTGIAVAGAPGSNVPRTCIADRDCGSRARCLDFGFCARVDFSGEKLASLYEASLDESVGVGGRPGDTDIVFYLVPGAPTVELTGPAYGPIDWNGDGVIGPGRAEVDVNNDGYQEVLSGFDDWSAVRAWINTSDYRNGVRRNAVAVQCTPPRRR